MLLGLAQAISFSLGKAKEMNTTYYSYGVLFYKPGRESDAAVELISKFNEKTAPIFQIMVADCQLPYNSNFCAENELDRFPYLKYFNIYGDEKTAVYDGDFEENDLWLDILTQISNPWNISPHVDAIIPFLAENKNNTLFLFTPGPYVPLLFLKLGFIYGYYFQLIWQPGFRTIGSLDGFPIGEGLKPGKTNLVAAIDGQFFRHEGRWTKSAISSFVVYHLNERPTAHEAANEKEEL